ncbi:MAG: DUF4157 domain-containing protein [Deltaproteobacteria bacterium]|nr:DUF4157 domain-containing protein [Deltaproteobacteria bacterium]
MRALESAQASEAAGYEPGGAHDAVPGRGGASGWSDVPGRGAPVQAKGLDGQDVDETIVLSGGAPLPAEVRRQMEAAFGADFGTVRVREDARVGALGAEAVASGEHIEFAPGKMSFSTQAGRELLGHELAHVLQQRAGRVARPTEGNINGDASLEAEADRAGELAARGEQVAGDGGAGVVGPAAQGPIQLKKGDKDKDKDRDKLKRARRRRLRRRNRREKGKQREQDYSDALEERKRLPEMPGGDEPEGDGGEGDEESDDDDAPGGGLVATPNPFHALTWLGGLMPEEHEERQRTNVSHGDAWRERMERDRERRRREEEQRRWEDERRRVQQERWDHEGDNYEDVFRTYLHYLELLTSLKWTDTTGDVDLAIGKIESAMKLYHAIRRVADSEVDGLKLQIHTIAAPLLQQSNSSSSSVALIPGPGAFGAKDRPELLVSFVQLNCFKETDDKNITDCVAYIAQHNGRTSGGGSRKSCHGHTVFHISHGIQGGDDGCTIFFIITGNQIVIVGIGKHKKGKKSKKNKTYMLSWYRDDDRWYGPDPGNLVL